MRYLFVDRILDCKNGKHIRGIKNIAMAEDFLELHFPRNPVMPGVLLIEALAQLAGWLEASSSGFESWLLLQRVEKCMFYSPVLPGDQVELEVTVQEPHDPVMRRYLGLCTVGGKKKVVAEFEGVQTPLTDLEDISEQKRLYSLLWRA
jgi:3-hydroxyacyl-[acyl-carrier-protein] dehydratase